MQDRDVPLEQLNSVANYAILSQPDNAELGEQAPFDVWRTLKPNQRECASLQLCFLGLDNLLQYEAYDEFVSHRSEKLSEKLNEFLGLGK